MLKFDVVIVGSGLAGLTVALNLASNYRIALITKDKLLSGSSDHAQGGIAAVLDDDDSIEQHVKDTLTAGSFLGDDNATQFVIENSKNAIQWLIEQGVPFTKDETTSSGYHLTREGGHSHRRIIHAADTTGHAVMSVLANQVRQHHNITVFEHHITIDTINTVNVSQNECNGVYVQDVINNQTIAIAAGHTILATGGAGQVYLHTTNPDTSTGDGIAIAYRSGCRVANMEFMQFHPTTLFHPQGNSFLISEALRGEGAVLKVPASATEDAGKRFMEAFDERLELAPRDIVARAIDATMKKYGVDHVDLDISHQPAAFIRQHFPAITEKCLSLGIDITTQPIPVVPASHYTCGGVITDIKGHTDVQRLYAVGETAYTGLHGANRLASNSLLECLVIGQAVAADIMAQPVTEIKDVPEWDQHQLKSSADEDAVIRYNMDEVRQIMSTFVGIVRTTKRLERAKLRIRLLREELMRFYAYYTITPDLIALRNMIDVAHLIITSALTRKESRGLHFNTDFPNQLNEARPSIVVPSKLN